MTAMRSTLVAILLIASAGLHAQAALLVLIFGDKVATEKFHLSIDAGGNLPLINGIEGDPHPGWHFGLGTHYNFAPNWQFVGEFTPLNSGGLRNIPQLNFLPDSIEDQLSNRQNKWNLNTLHLPLMFRYSVTDRFHIASGPVLNLILKAEEERTARTSQGIEVTFVEDIRDRFKRIQFGWNADLSYSLSDARKGKGIDIRLRYNHFFTNILKSDEELDARLGSFQLILTFPFILNEE